MLKIPWATMLIQIHNRGFSWPGLGDLLAADYAGVRNYANRNHKTFKVTYERGTTILRLYEALFPESYEAEIKPILQKEIDRLRHEEAMRQLLKGAP